MSDVSLKSSGMRAVSQQAADFRTGSEATPASAQEGKKAGLSQAQIARLFGMTTHELEAYEAALAQKKAEEAAAAATQAQAASEPVAEVVVEAPPPAPLFAPWTGGKPRNVQELIDFMSSRGVQINLPDAAHFLHADVGTNTDLRNFGAILNADDPFAANNQALGYMFNGPHFKPHAAQEKNMPGQESVRAGNLLWDDNRLYAYCVNVAKWVALKLPKTEMKSGGLARYGITQDEIKALASNTQLPEKAKALLQDLKATGYQSTEATQYVSLEDAPFDLTTVIGNEALHKK